MKAVLDLRTCRLTIGGIPVRLSTLEFFYYRFFAERAVRGEGAAVITDPLSTPPGFREALRRYEMELFPERTSLKTVTRPPSIGTFRTTISRTNGKILRALGPGRSKSFRILSEGPKNARRYCLTLRNSQVVINSSNVLEVFGKPVSEYTINRQFIDALVALRTKNYSQIVVRINGVLRLLTIDGMARWLAAQDTRRPISLETVTIRDVLKYERKDNVECVGTDLSVLDVRTYFSNRLDSSKPNLVALIITDSGKPTGKPLGIITAADFLDKRYW